MTADFTPDDQDKLANTLLMLIEDLVTELHTDKIHSFVLSLDSSLDDDLVKDTDKSTSQSNKFFVKYGPGCNFR